MISATTNYQAAEALFVATGIGQVVYLVEIDGYSRAFVNIDQAISGQYDWLNVEQSDQLSITVNDLDGGADQVSWGFYVQDRGGAVTSDFPGFVFEGKQVTLKSGFVGLATADYITLFTGYIDTVASANSNTEYYFSCSDLSSKLKKVVYATGDDGQPTSSDHIKTLNGHPLDILQSIILTEVGLDPTLLDTAKLAAYKDGPFTGLNFVFHLTQAPQADEFIKAQLLKPLGGYMWVTGEGKITVNFFYPLAGPIAVATLGPDSWTTIPSAEQTDMVNTVQLQFDKDDATSNATGNYLSQDTEEYGPSTSLYGQYGESVIQADGVRSAFQGFLIAKLTSRMIFLRYGLKNLKFDQDAAEAFWPNARLEPGDIVSVTHPQIPDRAAGVMGITSKLFEVLNKSVDLAARLAQPTMLDASYLSTFGFYKITPDDEADYASASTGDKAEYMFMSNSSGVYSNADEGHPLG